MRRVLGNQLAAFFLLFFVLGFLATVHAEPFDPKVSTITSYQDFLFGTREVRENIDTVQCGGIIDPGTGLDDGTVPIATVTGVPGRSFDPVGNIVTGVGVRNSFEYPDVASTYGFKTACDVRNSEINPERLCLIDDNTATPEQCRKLYQRLTVELPQMVADGSFSSGNPSISCKTWDDVQHYCFQFSSECFGADCRTPTPPVFGCAGTVVVAQQSSFYRHYGANVRTIDGQQWDFDTECYELYKERDPKDRVMSEQDEQCEIVLSDSAPVPPDRLPEWQDRDDIIAQKGRTALRPEDVQEDPRLSRSADEPWKLDEVTNLALIDYHTWAEEYADTGVTPRLSDLFGAPLESKQKASKLGGNAHTDMFDDTGDRDFSYFWDREQRALLSLTRDPQVRLILPAAYMHGLSDDDPLFDLVSTSTPLPTGAVQVTLRAGLEDLGVVLQSLAESKLFRIEEVKIPVLLPIAGDIDTRLKQWETWQRQEDLEARLAERASYAGEAGPVIDRLNRYKERLNQVRNLRNSLLLYSNRILERDNEMRRTIADWYADIANQIETANAGEESRRELQRIWKLLQRSMLLADECQLLWCSNQRYSAPIYSLLDAWWGDRLPGEGRNASYQPKGVADLGLIPPPDILLDFSRFTFSTNTIQIPVFDPIQVRINLPVPVVGEKPNLSGYPESLPDIPADDLFVRDIPNLTKDDLPSVSLPSPLDLEEAKTRLRDIRRRIDGTDRPDGFPPDQFPRDSMLGALCRFTDSATEHRPSETVSTRKTILHVENDLRERIARLFARWMPETMQDFYGHAKRVSLGYPPVENGCTDGLLCLLLPKEDQRTTSYAWFAPESLVDAQDLVRQVRDITLPASEQNPYARSEMNVLRMLFPSIPLPAGITLTINE